MKARIQRSIINEITRRYVVNENGTGPVAGPEAEPVAGPGPPEAGQVAGPVAVPGPDQERPNNETKNVCSNILKILVKLNININ